MRFWKRQPASSTSRIETPSAGLAAVASLAVSPVTGKRRSHRQPMLRRLGIVGLIALALLPVTQQHVAHANSSNLTAIVEGGFVNGQIGVSSVVPAHVSVDWGDGSATQTDYSVDNDTLPWNPGCPWNCAINGYHQYTQVGLYSVKITIDNTSWNSITSLVNVLPRPVIQAQATHTTVSTLSPVVSNTVPLADFTILGIYTGVGLAQYTATIDWGDGTSSTGTLGFLLGGCVPHGKDGGCPVLGTTVYGSHTYAGTPPAGTVYPLTIHLSQPLGGLESGFPAFSQSVTGNTVTVTN
jgi:hypothetical protein